MKKHYIWLLLFLLLPYQLYSQSYNGPQLFTENHLPKQYNAEIQNWCILQDNNGLIYIGNTEGLIVYDGYNYELIETDNKEIIRSMNIDTNGKVYIGSYGTFGYIEPNKLGKLEYKSLIHLIPEEHKKFQDVWFTHIIDNIVYFVTYYKEYAYDGTSIKVTEFKDRLSYSATFRNKNYYLFKDKDTKYLNHNNKRILNINQESIGRFMEIEDENLLLFGYKTYLFKVLFDENNNLIDSFQINTVYDDYFKQTYIYNSHKLKNENYLFATLNTGSFYFNKDFTKSKRIFKDNGLSTSDCKFIYADNNNLIWLALNNGFASCELFSPITFWNQKSGLNGVIEDIIEYNDYYHIITHEGIYKLKNDSIYLIEKTVRKHWDLIKIEIPEKNISGIFDCYTTGVGFISDNLEQKKIHYVQNHAFCGIQSKHNKNRVFVGWGDSIRTYYFNDKKWKYEKTIKNAADEFITIVEDNNGDIWAGTTSSGVYHIQFNSNNDNLVVDTVKIYDKAKGIPELSELRLHKHNNKILLSTAKGLYYYDKKSDYFYQDTSYGEKVNSKNNTTSNFASDKSGNFVISGSSIHNGMFAYYKKNKNNTYTIIEEPFSRIPEMMIMSLYFDSKGKLWIGGSEGLYCFNPDLNYDYMYSPYNTIIRKVTINPDSTIFYGNYYTNIDSIRHSALTQPESLKLKLDYSYNSITFYFAATSYFKKNKNEYSYFLEGYDKEWSKYVKLNQKEYTNLPEGKYTFYVKSKNLYNIEGNTTSFEFTIIPPWYRTWWAYTIYIISTLLTIYIIIKIYTRRIVKQKEHLEKIVNIRTAEIKSQNEEIQSQAEELATQAEELAFINQELEKLSIVASKTDNAVMIMDNDAYFEWVNEAFTQLYQCTFNEFTKKYGNNLYDASDNKNISDIIKKCINTKQTVVYESKINHKNSTVYLQTTLTPITDNMSNDVTKLIAIETDITKIKQAERALLRKNEHINASIRYAKTIQNAILPFIQSIPFENFIIFRPKDIVSGDFYWHTSINESTHFLAVVDCTGHGVPGAFMSMIGSRLLNEIVNERKIYQTNEIIELLDNLVNKSLQQEQSENNDGMDLSLIKVEKNKHDFTINYTCAKNALYYFNNENKELIRYKADRRSVGGIRGDRKLIPFTSNKIIARKNDLIYLLSDGLIDQSNGERKRFGTVRLKNWITENHTNKMNEQKISLESILNNWQQNEKQRDDITVIGLKMQ